MELPERVEIDSGFKFANLEIEFIVESKLGEGGFGTVFLITDSHKNQYALKVCELWKMKPNDYDQINDRFKVGYEAGKTISSNIVRNYFYGKIKGNPFIVMEYCPSGSLNERKDEFYTYERHHHLGLQILNGLRSLHEHGIIHRDIKPQNVLFDKDHVAKLSDFDIAGRMANRMTVVNWLGVTKEVWGTALYAPPEQLNNRNAYHALKPCIDMFAFGVMMYEVVTGGFYPYGDYDSFQENPVRYYEKIRKGEYTPIRSLRPDIHPLWEYVIESCINPEPKDRMASPADALSALNVISDPATSTSNPENATNWALKVRMGDDVSKIYHLTHTATTFQKETLTVGWFDGNESNNDIDILERHTSFISTKHATLSVTDGKWKLKDGQRLPNGLWKHSVNGTYVNGEELASDHEKVLNHGDIILIGEVTLQVINY